MTPKQRGDKLWFQFFEEKKTFEQGGLMSKVWKGVQLLLKFFLSFLCHLLSAFFLPKNFNKMLGILKVTRKLHLRHFVNLKSQVKSKSALLWYFKFKLYFLFKAFKEVLGNSIRFVLFCYFVLYLKIMKPEQFES